MAKRSSLRASDADRDRVVERLHQAGTEGRLFAHELEERISKALRARTYGDLDEVVFDLPGAAPERSRSRPRQLLFSHPATAVAVLVLGSIIAFMLAALVVATVIAFGGVWIILAVVVLMFRGRRFGRYYGPRPPVRGPGSQTSRWVR